MSRPWSSVPSRWPALPCALQAGGANAALRSSEAASNGLVGAIQGASSAPPTQASVNAAATMVTGDLRKLYARSWFQIAWRVHFSGSDSSTSAAR